MSVSVLFVVGRFLFAVPFVMIGTDRLLDDGATGAQKAWALLAMLATVGVVLGVYGDVAALVLAVAIIGIGIADAPEDDARFQLVGLLGGAICIAALYLAVGTAIDWTITDPLIDLDLR